jgi:hypothetical protein
MGSRGSTAASGRTVLEGIPDGAVADDVRRVVARWEKLDAKELLTPDAAITVPATGLRPQAHVRRGSPTARVTPQKDGRFKSVVISLCRFVDRPTMQAAASSREGHDDEAPTRVVVGTPRWRSCCLHSVSNRGTPSAGRTAGKTVEGQAFSEKRTVESSANPQVGPAQYLQEGPWTCRPREEGRNECPVTGGGHTSPGGPGGRAARKRQTSEPGGWP